MTAESTSPSRDQNYIAIIGDLRHSRRIRSRAELQRRLIATAEDLNKGEPDRLLQQAMATPVAMTAGDEFQSLLSAGWPVAEIIERMMDSARPAQFTFGIGLGAITTDLSPSVALIDGPAFHNARSALEKARRERVTGSAKGFGLVDDLAIGAILGLTGSVRAKWTTRQQYFIEQIRLGKGQSEIAEEEDISPSVVSESLNTAAFRPYEIGRAALLLLLDRHLPGAAP